MVRITLTHNLLTQQRWVDLPFDISMSIDAFKQRVTKHTGSTSAHMQLDHISSSTGERTRIAPTGFLGDYPIEDGDIVFVMDNDPNSILLQLSAGDVEKYEIPRERYLKMPGTAHEFLKNLSKDKPQLFQNNAIESLDDAIDHFKTEYHVCNRDDLISGGYRGKIANTSMVGTIRYLGKVSQHVSKDLALNPMRIYIGIRLDDPVGNFNGVDPDGTCSFNCDLRKYGLFVPYRDVMVGDYPPIDWTCDDLDEI